MVMTSCVAGDRAGCGVWLEFSFERNMTYADRFGDEVGAIEVWLFDPSGRFLRTARVAAADLHRGNRLMVEGGCRVVTVGVSDASDAGFRAEGATLDEFTLTAENHASGPPPDLWLGPTIETPLVDVAVVPVPLTRLTNRFTITLHSAPPGDSYPHLPITVGIVSPEAGAYDRSGRPVATTPTIYEPWSHDGTTARIATMRLLESMTYRLEVGGESFDLLWLLGAAKPATRPDGTPLPMQEYLDRERDWLLDIVYREGPGGGPLPVSLAVGGWIVWQHGIDV